MVFLGTLAGCRPPSLLITPVSGRHDLVETELSRDSFLATTKIALIDVTGVILNAPQPQLLSTGEHPVSYLLEQLDKARRDRQVKGVLLRINSPGGSVVASELMHEEIQRFKKSGKPIVAVLMDVAASGGYYIACACDEIVAQPSTVTGSIGVIMQMLDVSKTLELIGVKAEAITSGDFKDAGSPLRSLRPEERAVFQAIVNDMYGRFVAVVAAGRKSLDEARVRTLADGRVYTASQALEHKLIDRIASLHDAVDGLKEKLGTPRIRLVTYHRRHDYRPNYYAAAPSTGDINLLKTELPGAFPTWTPRFMYLWLPGR